MELANVQAFLARLYTDAALRERFYDDPQQMGEASGLSAEDAQQLAQLSVAQVDFFVNSLKRKRLNEVHRLLPMSCDALGDKYARLFLRHVEHFIPEGTGKHRYDAISFAAFVEETAPADGIQPWVVQLARYEAAWLAATRPTQRWTIRWFRYSIPEILMRLQRQDELESLRLRPSIGLWVRVSRHARLQHVILALPTTRRSVPPD